jgi:hypothetical protein
MYVNCDLTMESDGDYCPDSDEPQSPIDESRETKRFSCDLSIKSDGDEAQGSEEDGPAGLSAEFARRCPATPGSTPVATTPCPASLVVADGLPPPYADIDRSGIGWNRELSDEVKRKRATYDLEFVVRSGLREALAHGLVTRVFEAEKVLSVGRRCGERNVTEAVVRVYMATRATYARLYSDAIKRFFTKNLSKNVAGMVADFVVARPAVHKPLASSVQAELAAALTTGPATAPIVG